MNEQVMNLLTAVGGIAEILGDLREKLLKNGFTRAEALQMCCAFLTTMATNAKQQKEE